MKFTYENQGTNTYLVYKVTPDDMVDTMSLGMITNNRIDGLAPAVFTQMDATRYIKYNVSSKISVSQFFSGHVNKKRLLGVFSGIVDALLSAEDYMIDENSILLDLNYIFADVSSCETVLICLPVMDLSVRSVDLGIFFKNIIFSTQFDPTENCDHVAKIINYLNSSPVFSLHEFKSLLEQIKGGTSPVQNKSEQPKVPQQQIGNQPQNMVHPQSTISQQSGFQNHTMNQQQNTFGGSSNMVSGNNTSLPDTSSLGSVKPFNSSSNTTNSAGKSFDIPGGLNIPKKEPQKEPQKEAVTSNEKPMSMFYLLQHYNKENAALYKAQKEAKKNAKVEEKPKDKKKDKKQGKKTVSNPGFTVPGAPGSDTGFAIPGTQSNSSEFSVPGKIDDIPPTAPVTNSFNNPNFGQQNGGQQNQVLNNAFITTQNSGYQTQMYQQTVVPHSESTSFGETVVLNAGGVGETTVLNAQSAEVKIQPHLIRQKNGERIELNKPVFRIGKEKSYVDYFIGDNTAISRSHANIISRDGEFFVLDTNSTNHTYLNGAMIQSSVEVKLVHGMKVRFANEDFDFYTH